MSVHTHIKIACDECNDGYVERYDYGFPGSKCGECEGRGEVTALCDGLLCDGKHTEACCQWGAEYLCADCAADYGLDEGLVAASVRVAPDGRASTWL